MADDKNRDRFRGTTEEVEQAARALRREPTPAEAALWERLRGRRLDGFKFRAQHPMGRFIFDFSCAQARLVVEVDGEVHQTRRARDAERDAVLSSSHYRVVRFSNEQILDDMEAVVGEIRQQLVDVAPTRARRGSRRAGASRGRT